MLFNCSGTIFILLWVLSAGSCLAIDDENLDDTDFHLRSQRSLVSKGQLLQTSNFFQLFKIPYIICFFAATGKWPFIPPFLQVKVNQVSRSLFVHNDEYIKHYCQEWITVVQCHRPLPTDPTMAPTTMSTTTMEPTEPEPEETTTECVCGRRSLSRVPNNEIVYMDKAFGANVSVETIQTTIEFLNSLLRTTKRRKPKTRNRLNVSPREN